MHSRNFFNEKLREHLIGVSMTKNFVKNFGLMQSLICVYLILLCYSGVFSTGATGAMAPIILRKRLIAPAVSNRNGKILLTLGTRNIKILNTLCTVSSLCMTYDLEFL